MSAARTRRSPDPTLPVARGPLSAAVIDALRYGGEPRPALDDTAPDAYGDDLQLALYVCYDLHYRGFAGVDDRWEWNPSLLAVRARLERSFLDALRRDVPRHRDVDAALDDLLVEPVDATGLSAYLRDEGSWWQMREYAAHRSLYQLKESDPYVWVIPRLQGQAKASLTAIEFDEFGAGHGDRVHARLFADLMRGMGLDDRYGHYLDLAPAPTLAVANIMSTFGLHRALRGALVGHFATVEITSPPGARRLVQALERLDAPSACVRFYAEHVEADAVHEQVMRHQVVADLLDSEPDLAEDVVWGIDTTNFLEHRFAAHVDAAWHDNGTSLLRPLDQR